MHYTAKQGTFHTWRDMRPQFLQHVRWQRWMPIATGVIVAAWISLIVIGSQQGTNGKHQTDKKSGSSTSQTANSTKDGSSSTNLGDARNTSAVIPAPNSTGIRSSGGSSSSSSATTKKTSSSSSSAASSSSKTTSPASTTASNVVTSTTQAAAPVTNSNPVTSDTSASDNGNNTTDITVDTPLTDPINVSLPTGGLLPDVQVN